ncbi:MAG: hypothetical protein AAF799_16660 [Myxococcota bacterium]
MNRRTALASSLFVTALALNTGCWYSGSDIPVIEAGDLEMEPPGSDSFRQAGDRGEVYDLALEVSDDVNTWVTDIAVGMSRLVHELDQHRPNREEDGWRIYGPHDDDEGKDASWMARITGDSAGASFEVYIGRRGASEDEMRLLIDGDVSVADTERDGHFSIDFDTIAAYADVMDDVDPDAEFGGSIVVEFERDTNTRHKRVDLDFDGFFYDDGEDDLDFDGEKYLYFRDDEGAGRFHFAAISSFESDNWSGPELERMTVDMRWDTEQAGRARGQILEVDGVGDLRHGDLMVNECFDGSGGLVWRSLNEPYAGYEPDYSFGDEADCVFDESALMVRE